MAHKTDGVEGVDGVLAELDDLAAANEAVNIGDVLDDFGERSFGPFILLPALLEISPIGGIPGVPSVLAALIAVIAAQLLWGKDHVWLPQFVQQRGVFGKKLHKAVGKLRGISRWLDEHSQDRLERLVEGVWIRIAAGLVILLCCTVPPLEFLPFASTLPMAAIAAFGLALTVRDGLFMLIALIVSGIAAVGAVWFYFAPPGSSGMLPFL
ncbi:exopolysaccharide biosynthesis protein [Erythrobacter litoralis]|uniref:exopolysaccharide biosynthesis protein n=1 Tax=Erythrobacter litoralis TaxID=39960 RepID=UPI002434BFAF|nr:exopolysaccharide biosynthesis protein [Erythrobacter litoralis]MDG6079075.1 exopolysaccharide biosynthesis protein [Erythrobacter litoralis]